MIAPLRPPAGAPNVLIILLDDVGFGSFSVFGGPVNTPTAERLAAEGLKFNRFHTTALCAPTRAALLTGRNHHAVGMGSVPDLATSAPGHNSIRPGAASPDPASMRLQAPAPSRRDSTLRKGAQFRRPRCGIEGDSGSHAEARRQFARKTLLGCDANPCINDQQAQLK